MTPRSVNGSTRSVIERAREFVANAEHLVTCKRSVMRPCTCDKSVLFFALDALLGEMQEPQVAAPCPCLVRKVVTLDSGLKICGACGLPLPSPREDVPQLQTSSQSARAQGEKMSNGAPDLISPDFECCEEWPLGSKWIFCPFCGYSRRPDSAAPHAGEDT